MRFNYQPTFDTAFEAVLLLLDACGPDAELSLQQRYAKDGSRLEEDEREALALIQSVRDRALSRIALTEEERDLLACDLPSESTAAYGSALFPAFMGFTLTPDDWEQAVLSLDEGVLRHWALYVSNLLVDDRPHEPISMARFQQLVLAERELSAENKCHILKNFLHYHETFQSAMRVVRRAQRVLEEELPALAPLLAKWNEQAAPVAEQGEAHPVIAALCASVPAIKESNTIIQLRPSFCIPLNIALSLPAEQHLPKEQRIYPEQQASVMIGLLGMQNEQVSTFLDIEMSEASVLSSLKLLSDRSKFDILRILRDEPCYGAHLAQRTGLSPATVSHHMNALLGEKLVQFDARDNRLYYRLDADQMRRLIRQMERVFLGE